MRIVADSSVLLSPSDGKQLGITIIPACTVINDQVYKDYVDVSGEEFVKLLREGVKATTSQPAVGDVMDIFEDSDEELLMLSIGDGLSGTYQSAVGVKNSMDSNEHIHILDTKTLGGPQRYLTTLAVQLKEKGFSLREIVNELQKRIQTSVSFVIPFDFEFLRRSGRLTPIAAKLGGILKIVPVLTQTEDMKRIEVFTIKRSKRKALDSIAERLKKLDLIQNSLITISHAGTPEDANWAKERLKDFFPNASFEIYHLSPSLVAHGGPGSIVIQAIKK